MFTISISIIPPSVMPPSWPSRSPLLTPLGASSSSLGSLSGQLDAKRKGRPLTIPRRSLHQGKILHTRSHRKEVPLAKNIPLPQCAQGRVVCRHSDSCPLAPPRGGGILICLLILAAGHHRWNVILSYSMSECIVI